MNGTYLVYIINSNPKSCTILLHGPSLSVMDEIERVCPLKSERGDKMRRMRRRRSGVR